MSAWIWVNKQDYQYVSVPKYDKSFEYGKVLNMRALHCILNMPEYALTEFWIDLKL